MKKFFLTIIVFVAIGVSAFTINIPKAITDAFAKQFPGATNIKWGKENAKEYEAEFTLNNKSVSANFLADGSWVETESEISGSEIPGAVTSAVSKKYPGATLLKTYKIETAKGITTYEAEVKNGSKKSELIIDENGKIIK
jgi:Putative beta-lactamase-inhibitor-like, PepSY-like